MACTISTNSLPNGMRTIVLENETLHTTILPEYGAKIFEVTLKKHNHDLLYHNPRVEIRTPVFGANVDNWWHGGIDECIPTGQPSHYNGEDYPYLGELWSLPWKYIVEENSSKRVTIRLSRTTIISPLLVERWMSINSDQSVIEMRHKITNLGYTDFQFLWGIHPGIAVTDSSRIDLPRCSVTVDESSPNNRLGPKGTTYDWPYAKTNDGKTIDMRRVLPPESQTCDLHYATQFTEGWLSVTNSSSKTGIGLVFPKNVFKCIWLWLVYGGWRALHCVAVEAWTGYPGRLDEAVKNGNYSALPAGETLSCDTKVVAYDGVTQVGRITTDGTVMSE
jgi:galactose mutarotase-like enzyme